MNSADDMLDNTVDRTMAGALRAQSLGDAAAAHALIDQAVEQLAPDDMERRSRLIAFRGDLYAESGDVTAALDAYQAALSLSGDSYRRYSLELSLGALFEQLGRLVESIESYVNAIRISLTDNRIAAGTAVKRLLKVRGNRLPNSEQSLAELAVERSWHLLQLPGDPPRADLASCADTLIDAAGKADDNTF